MERFLKFAYQPYKWLIVIPFIILNTMILGVICIFTALMIRQKKANAVAVLWAKLCCAIVPFKVKIIGKNNYDTNKSYVIVSNHQSMADIPVVHANLGLNIKWVMKKELNRIPVFGTSCRYLGCIPIDRSNHMAAVQTLSIAKETMSKTASIFFFAEGTRSRDGKVMPFKKGAFMFAQDTGLPILPVTIKNSAGILPSDSLDLRPGTIELIVHQPIQPTDFAADQMEQFIIHTRKIISRPLTK